MSKNSSVELVLKREGLVRTNDPDDPGKDTFCGISRRYNPQWKGWKFVDEKQPEVAMFWVKDFYADFWDGMNVGVLNCELLADSVFDYGVNEGPMDAIKILQETLNYLKHPVKITGNIGPITRDICNRIHVTWGSDRLLRNYAAAKCMVYADRVRLDKVKEKYLRGWILRAWEQVGK